MEKALDDERFVTVLSEAIKGVDTSDERLSRRIRGEFSPQQIAELRAGTMNPLPRWHEMSNLLGLCDLAAEDIGQPISDPSGKILTEAT